jgi:hypothetical protein
MRTDIIIKSGAVAVKTERLKTLLRKVILPQPAIEGAASTDLTAMLSTVVIDVINGQHICLRLPTANASSTISSDGFLTQVSVPDLNVGFLTNLAAKMLAPVAIRAEKLKAFLGVVILAKPSIEAVSVASHTAMLSAIIADMVNRKKSRIRFAADSAFAAIGNKDLLTKIITILLMLRMATVANGATRFDRANNTRATHTSLPFLRCTLAIILIQMSTNFLLLLRGFGKQSFTPFLNNLFRALRMSKIFITAARLANAAQTIFRTAKFTKTISSEPLLAIRTKLMILQRSLACLRNILFRHKQHPSLV